MSNGQILVQIGKNGFTPGILEVIKNHFKTKENIKISILKNAGHTKENVKEIAEKIQKELGAKFTYRIVGFAIFLKKWRKERGN